MLAMEFRKTYQALQVNFTQRRILCRGEYPKISRHWLLPHISGVCLFSWDNHIESEITHVLYRIPHKQPKDKFLTMKDLWLSLELIGHSRSARIQSSPTKEENMSIYFSGLS